MSAGVPQGIVRAPTFFLLFHYFKPNPYLCRWCHFPFFSKLLHSLPCKYQHQLWPLCYQCIFKLRFWTNSLLPALTIMFQLMLPGYLFFQSFWNMIHSPICLLNNSICIPRTLLLFSVYPLILYYAGSPLCIGTLLELRAKMICGLAMDVFQSSSSAV